MKVIHSRTQHGVGQGSFHSATVDITSESGEHHRFDYVYDCGALAGRYPTKELGRSIKRLSLEGRTGCSKPVLDVLALSHFDRDHMNGARDLVRSVRVDHIVLPYIGPMELAFVIASQAAELEDDIVTALHGVANGGGVLWGRKVVMVRKGSREPGADEPNRQPTQEIDSDRGRGANDPLGRPKSVRIVIEGGDSPLSQEVSDEKSLVIKAASDHVWTLRFWNRGLDPVLRDLLAGELRSCGFPVAALRDANHGAVDITNWLADRSNRDQLMGAYRSAIRKHQPNWRSSAESLGLSNFLSLGMYAGPPIEWPQRSYRHRRLGANSRRGPWSSCLICGSCYETGLVSWLGTGDAPLGETAVWDDFRQHYRRELPTVGTVLVPHHGAAPNAGPRYYHSGLNHQPGVTAVISYGTTNIYGHPKTSVVTQILAADGELQLVNEQSLVGFHEVYTFEP